jgi:hypothetical protein
MDNFDLKKYLAEGRLNEVEEDDMGGDSEGSELYQQLIRAIEDIRLWVVDEQNPKKFRYLISNIDYAMKLAKEIRKELK